MSDDGITKFDVDPDNRPTLRDAARARLEAMTDEEIEAAARSDPDAQPLTAAELEQFERAPNLKAIRAKLGLSQKEFAETFHLPLHAVRDWENGCFITDRAARTLLKVIAHNPEVVIEALSRPS